MKVVQINTMDIKGGAAIVAYGLHKKLLAEGHDSKMFVGQKLGSDPEVYTVPCNNKLLHRFKIAYRNKFGPSDPMLYSDEASGKFLSGFDIVRDADIVHIHNTHGNYLNLTAAGRLSMEKRVVWTLHDQFAITGHCAYSFGCDRWRVGCGSCPQLETYPAIKKDTSAAMWKIKARSYDKAAFSVTVPSMWLHEQVCESMLAGAPLAHIPNAVDTEVFRPEKKPPIRTKLGLPHDRFILLFTADGGSRGQFKGFNYLKEALSILKEAGGYNPYLVMIGEKDAGLLDSLGFGGQCIGHIYEPARMASYTNAADAFILPSTAENSPLVVIESLACGTPVIAFGVGGVPELVAHKENGYIASERDSASLAEGIEWLMDRGGAHYEAICSSAVRTVAAKHTIDQQYENFLEIYEGLTELSVEPGLRVSF